MSWMCGRRRFLQSVAALGWGAGCAATGLARLHAAEATPEVPQGARFGGKLCCSAYSFHKLTFFETVEQVATLGLGAIEAFTWQPLAPERAKVPTNPDMSAADRKLMAKKLADAGVKLVNCYCQTLDEPAAARRLYEWAKELGVTTLVAEPAFESYDHLEKLCEEYGLNLAIHNHPQPSQYWNPATVLKQCQGRSPRIGACCDTGHWVRSGFQPVEALKLLQGRILTLHLKDVESFGRTEAPCVPWGTGAGQIEALLQELQRQSFQGYLGIEYEPYAPENAEKIAQCIRFFQKTTAQLAK